MFECEKCDFEAQTHDELVEHQKEEHNLFGSFSMGVETEE